MRARLVGAGFGSALKMESKAGETAGADNGPNFGRPTLGGLNRKVNERHSQKWQEREIRALECWSAGPGLSIPSALALARIRHSLVTHVL